MSVSDVGLVDHTLNILVFLGTYHLVSLVFLDLKVSDNLVFSKI